MRKKLTGKKRIIYRGAGTSEWAFRLGPGFMHMREKPSEQFVAEQDEMHIP